MIQLASQIRREEARCGDPVPDGAPQSIGEPAVEGLRPQVEQLVTIAAIARKALVAALAGEDHLDVLSGKARYEVK